MRSRRYVGPAAEVVSSAVRDGRGQRGDEGWIGGSVVEMPDADETAHRNTSGWAGVHATSGAYCATSAALLSKGSPSHSTHACAVKRPPLFATPILTVAAYRCGRADGSTRAPA